MNSVIAQGAEGSLIRKFQDNPHMAVELLQDNEALRKIILRHVKAVDLNDGEKAAFNRAAHNFLRLEANS